MTYCSICGSQLREGAQFCDQCGARVGEPSLGSLEPEHQTVDVHTEDVVRGAKIYVSQQRLFASIGSIFAGFIAIVMAAVAGSEFGSASGIMLLFGIGLIVVGILFWVLGGEVQEKY